jgi:hypothetical protein
LFIVSAPVYCDGCGLFECPNPEVSDFSLFLLSELFVVCTKMSGGGAKIKGEQGKTSELAARGHQNYQVMDTLRAKLYLNEPG